MSADNSLLSGVANGVEVEVKGTMSGGVLVASSVRVERNANLALGGTVTAVNAGAGTVTLEGVTLSVTGSTIFRDATAATPAAFNLANVMVGDYIGAVGYTDATAAPSAGFATRVVRLPAQPGALIAGPVSATTASSMTIFGDTVDLSAATTFLDSHGNPAGSLAAFIALITPGTTVAGAIGTWNAGTFTLAATGAKIGEIEN